MPVGARPSPGELVALAALFSAGLAYVRYREGRSSRNALRPLSPSQTLLLFAAAWLVLAALLLLSAGQSLGFRAVAKGTSQLIVLAVLVLAVDATLAGLCLRVRRFPPHRLRSWFHARRATTGHGAQLSETEWALKVAREAKAAALWLLVPLSLASAVLVWAVLRIAGGASALHESLPLLLFAFGLQLLTIELGALGWTVAAKLRED